MRFTHRMMAMWGLVAVMLLIPFSSASAYYKSPLDFSDDGYLRFGNSEYPTFEENGLRLDIAHSSISHSWVNMTMTMWGPMVEQRSISHFLILANSKVIEEFRPIYLRNEETGELRFSDQYYLKPSVPNLIGAPIYFQVVAVSRDSDGNQYVVGWSAITEEIQMDDLPVKDKEAISILYAILERLRQMMELLAKMLKELEEQTRPTQKKLDELYNAVNGLLDKMPMKQVTDELAELNNQLEEARKHLAKPGSLLILGGQVDLLPYSPGGEVMFMDLTDYKEQVMLFRKIMQAAIWVFFFHMLFKWVTPRPEV